MIHNKVHFITYGHGGINYEISKNRIVKQAHNFGCFTTISKYGYNDLTPAFKEKYKSILTYTRGAGYWIWKVDIIQQKLNEINDGEFIVYLDCGCTINPHGKKRFFEYLDLLTNSEYGVIDFEMQEDFNQVKKQCTKQVFDYFNLDTNSEIVNRGGCVPGVLIIKKNKHIQLILDEFIKVLDFDNNLVTDNYNSMPQHTSYWDHRHDQSIFTCLFIKYGAINIKRNESCTFGDTQTETSPDQGTFGSEKSLKYPFWATRLR
jgi:hypothetical protein